MEIKVAPTVAELIEELKKMEQDAPWYGFDDGTLVIVTSKGEFGIDSTYYTSKETPNGNQTSSL